MFEAFIVYFSLLLILITLALKGKFAIDKRSSIYDRNFAIISISSISIFSLVIGLRYYVGGDYPGYLDYYNSLNIKKIYNETHTEYGYYMLMFFLKFLGLPYTFLFICTSFLQIYFIYKWVNNYRFLLPWVIFFYFTSLYLFESMNIIRQAIAFSLILYSITFIYKSRGIQFIITIIFAALFHKSALFFLPFYFFIKKEWIKNKYIQIILVLLFLVFVNPLIDSLFNNFQTIAFILNYDNYSNSNQRADLFFDEITNSLGIAYYINLILNITILLYSDKLKEVYREYHYIAYHNMFYIIALLSSAATISNSIAISRSLFYFNSFRFIVLSFLCYYLFSIKKSIPNLIIGLLIISVFLIWFINAILKGAAWCAPFQFFFQEYTAPLRN